MPGGAGAAYKPSGRQFPDHIKRREKKTTEDKKAFGAEEILDIDELCKAAGGEGELAAWVEGILRKELKKRKGNGDAMEDVITEYFKSTKAPENSALMANWIRQVWDKL